MNNHVTIRFPDSEVSTKKVKSKKDGSEFEIREQRGVIETFDRKQPVRLALGDASPYPAGSYLLDLGRNLLVTNFESIQLKRNLELTPVPAASATK